MEERIIMAVSTRPELYAVSSAQYRDRNKKDLAWRRISEEIRYDGPQRKRARKRCTQDTSVQEPTRLELELEAYLQLHALKMSTSFALCVLSWIRGGN
uniref:MADF domain-containing protein n=1 Tax=Knipowitschia caucasica TaxID=637954 RepID=A0AAV2L5J5_KNICA